jgi:Arc/MetJ-type ribon-helix-helix transcriptional regulator
MVNWMGKFRVILRENGRFFWHDVSLCGPMHRHHITLSAPVRRALRAQVKKGRYKNFSAAVQDAAWHYFIEQPSLFQEYGVTAEEVAAAAKRDLSEIRRDRKAGRLKAWKP